MVVPWGYFLDVKNHKPLTFSRKIRGLRLLNMAVKERFERPIRVKTLSALSVNLFMGDPASSAWLSLV